MRHRVRGVMMIGAVLTCLVNGVAIAQDKPADEMEILREKARADKKLVVSTTLALTEGEAKVFWPVYNAYQSDMITHYDKLLKFIDRFTQAYDTMTARPAGAASKAEINRDVDAALAILYAKDPDARTLTSQAKAVLVFPSIVAPAQPVATLRFSARLAP